MGYGLYRQVEALGHDCMVVAQALIPKRSGEHKTNRARRVKLARLHTGPAIGQTGDAAAIRMGRDNIN